MSDKKPRLPDYLNHIVDATNRVLAYTAGMDFQGFAANRLVQDAVIRNFEIIGEASNNIERDHPDFAATRAYLPLSASYEMRNALAHGYYVVRPELVWDSIRTDLPPLLAQIHQAIDSLGVKNGPLTVDQSLAAAQAFVRDASLHVETPQFDHGRYTGTLLFETNHHFVQDIGGQSAVIHDKFRFAAKNQLAPEAGREIRVQYTEGRAVLTQGIGRGPSLGVTR